MKTKKETSFIYESFSPCPYYVPQKNKITLHKEKNNIYISRQYISDSGEISGKITYCFEINDNIENISRKINWGCSGVDKNSVELKSLTEKLKEIISKL